MKESTKDKIKGKAHEMTGAAKELAGKVTDNPKLQAKGVAEKVAGKLQTKLGQVEKVIEK